MNPDEQRRFIVQMQRQAEGINCLYGFCQGWVGTPASNPRGSARVWAVLSASLRLTLVQNPRGKRESGLGAVHFVLDF